MSENTGSNSKQQKQKFYKYNRGGGDAGGRGGGGRGRGRGRGRGLPGGSGGPSWMNDEGRMHNPLGRYREDPALEMMMAPGISVTTIQFKERSAEKELIEHLERIADELYPDTVEGASSIEASGDVEDQLKSELAGLSASSKSPRFRLCQHDTPCVIYVNVLAPLDPVRLVHSILQGVEASGRSPFRYVKRLVPLTAVSGATMHQLGELAKPIVEQGFTSPENTPLKFAIVTNNRRSDRLNRLDMIKRVADEVVALPGGHKVDLSNPDRTVIIDVDKNRLGLSVVTDYDRFKKFNPGSVAEAIAKAKAGDTVDGGAKVNAASEAATAPQNAAGEAAVSLEGVVSETSGGADGPEKRKADAIEGDEDITMGDGAGDEAERPSKRRADE